MIMPPRIPAIAVAASLPFLAAADDKTPIATIRSLATINSMVEKKDRGLHLKLRTKERLARNYVDQERWTELNRRALALEALKGPEAILSYPLLDALRLEAVRRGRSKVADQFAARMNVAYERLVGISASVAKGDTLDLPLFDAADQWRVIQGFPERIRFGAKNFVHISAHEGERVELVTRIPADHVLQSISVNIRFTKHVDCDRGAILLDKSRIVLNRKNGMKIGFPELNLEPVPVTLQLGMVYNLTLKLDPANSEVSQHSYILHFNGTKVDRQIKLNAKTVGLHAMEAEADFQVTSLEVIPKELLKKGK